jgi:hypothetical protein
VGCRKNCKADTSELRLASCGHCGAKSWNILGDSDAGYVLSEGEGKHCLLREKGTKKAKVVLCDKGGYTPLQLQCEQHGAARHLCAHDMDMHAWACDVGACILARPVCVCIHSQHVCSRLHTPAI